MAIQFTCPACAATLKVPDAAAGKKGTCPKCGTALLVPRIERPSPAREPVTTEPRDRVLDTAAAANERNLDFPDVPPDTPPASSPPETEDSLAFLAHVEPTLPVALPRESPTLRRLRRRRTGAWGVLIPLAFFTAFAGVGGWLYFRETTPRLEGTLRAQALEDELPPPGFITHLDANLPEDVFAQLLKDLAAEPPAPVKSNLMEVEFKPGPKALEVHLRPTPATQFFRVDLSDPALRRFRSEHAKRLGEPRREEFTAAAAEMLREWQQSGSISAARYRDAAGLNALLLPLSYHLQAVVDGRIYRAVAEDVGGRVYFLLPPQTRQFRIDGRELEDGRVLFPGKYTVKVVPRSPDPGQAPTSGTAAGESGTVEPEVTADP